MYCNQDNELKIVTQHPGAIRIHHLKDQVDDESEEDDNDDGSNDAEDENDEEKKNQAKDQDEFYN